MDICLHIAELLLVVKALHIGERLDKSDSEALAFEHFLFVLGSELFVGQTAALITQKIRDILHLSEVSSETGNRDRRKRQIKDNQTAENRGNQN